MKLAHVSCEEKCSYWWVFLNLMSIVIQAPMQESNAPDATAEDGPAPADLVCTPESQASSPKRLKRLNAFYNREDTSMWAELVAQAEKGDGPLASEFKALTMRTGSGDSVKEDGYENDTDLDRESSMAEHVDTPERQEVPDRHDDNEDGVILMPGNKKDPMTPMSDTTTVVLGEVGEEASQDEGKPALDDAKPRPIPTPLSNLEKEAGKIHASYDGGDSAIDDDADDDGDDDDGAVKVMVMMMMLMLMMMMMMVMMMGMMMGMLMMMVMVMMNMRVVVME